MAAAALRDKNNSLQTRYAHDVRELDKLKKTNVYSPFLPLIIGLLVLCS